MRVRFLFFVLIFSANFICSAQRIDNSASFRETCSNSSFRINYDNDLFMGSDFNYTQGFSFQLTTPALKSNPINYLFLRPKRAIVKYGLSIEHNSFTPYFYELSDIQYGERPFGAGLMMKSFIATIDTNRSLRLSSSLNLGLIGPAALGKEIQVGIHELTNSAIPQGWQHQVSSDLIFNYQMGIEYGLYRFRDLFSIQVEAAAKIGSLLTNISGGINTTFGIINSPFTSKTAPKFNIYLYAQPLISLVGYDATLQGGLLNRTSPYVIESGEIERLTGQFNCGLVIQTRHIYFEYSLSLLSKEFASGSQAKWGGIKIGFNF